MSSTPNRIIKYAIASLITYYVGKELRDWAKR